MPPPVAAHPAINFPMIKIVQLLLFVFAPPAMAADYWFSGTQEITGTGEILSADDIEIRTYQTRYSGIEGPWTVEAGVSWSEYGEDYAPIVSGEDAKLTEETIQADLSITRKWNESISGTLRFSAYDGFAEYRSIWTSEYYRQFFGDFEDYYPPDPHGHAFGASVDWDYLPGTGKAVFNFGYSRDEIAPGWSFNPEAGRPEPGRENLNTVSGSVQAEQVLAPWLKTGLNLTARKTTERSGRYGVANTWAASAGPLGFQINAGYTGESPSFNAVYASGLVEWNFLPQWSAYLGYRAYQDGGEIEASGFNALAPAIESREVFGGLRWDRGDLALSGGVGFLSTDYEPLSEENEFFGNLYKDRDWLTFRLSASYRF